MIERGRLLDLLLSGRASAPEAVAELARAADWRLPKTVAAVALDGPGRPALSPDVLYHRPILSPDVLYGLSLPIPCLLVPDPNGPGRAQLITSGLQGWRSAIGPALPLAEAATSLRWASEALALSRRGILPGGAGPIRCADHLATLLLFKDELLVATLTEVRLAPLAHLRPSQQDRLAETLLAWLRHGQSAGEVAAHLHIHPQTVRYRLRQLDELYGDQLADPDVRFELEIVLRARRATVAGARRTAQSGQTVM